MKNITYVTDVHVSCEGLSDNASFCTSKPELGHPKVYLKIQDSSINCPYCNHQFILKKEEVSPDVIPAFAGIQNHMKM